jgi:hypothetical protein
MNHVNPGNNQSNPIWLPTLPLVGRVVAKQRGGGLE